MSTDIKGSALYMIGVMKHRRHCRVGEAGPEGPCKTWTRMAVLVPCADIEPDGSAGIAAVPICGGHIEEAVIAFAKADTEG